MMNERKKGFTLAEVLIVLAIIGVVASMTIPALVQNTERQQLVEALKKSYGLMSQAFNLVVYSDKNEMTNIFSSNDSSAVLNVFLEKLNVVKNCGTDYANCMDSGTYKYLDGSTMNKPWGLAGSSVAVLADGTVIGLWIDSATCSDDWGSGPLDNTCGELFIDVNGNAPPNILGRDIFEFWIATKGIYPLGSPYDGFGYTCSLSFRGDGCSGKVLNEGAINY